MKIIVLLLTATIQAQTFSLLQDPKLAVMEDDYGNDPFTPALTVKVQGHDFENIVGHLTVGAKLEYAALDSGNYWRWGAEVGHSIEVYDYGHITPLIGYGVLSRWWHTWLSWEVSCEVGFNITDHWAFLMMGTYTQRGDWKKEFWREAFHIGIQYKL